MEPRIVLSADLGWLFDQPVDTHRSVVHVDHGHEHRMQFEFQGGRFYSEPLVTEAAPSGDEDAGDGTVWQGYDLAQTFLLHSNPGADHTIYLDVNGHVTSGTAWNTGLNGGQDIVTPAWSADADPNTFNDAEKATIQRIWARVAEDYAPFNVNVTTEEPPLDDLLKSDTGDVRWGTRVVVGPNTWYSSAGGVAYVGSFNWNSDTPCFVFNSSENGITEAASHEVGHTLGLSHDGNSTTSYYSGHGSGETSWGPLMGTTYSVNLSQWSKGEYLDANNPQDDLATITGQNGFGYRADDYGDILAEATELISAGVSQIDATYGIVETSADIDTFSFLAGAGAASISVDPFAVGPNLDILAELFDSAGSLIATSDSQDVISAGLDVDLPTEGLYFVQISGTGRGDPLADGYTDYASLGNYRIQGSVVPFTEGNAAPVAVDDQQATDVDTAAVIHVLANDSDPDGDPCNLDFATQGSHGSVVINPDKTITYTPNPAFEGQDTFTYTISDGQGGEDTAQVTISVASPVVLINGGFEDDLNGWEFSGDASAQTGDFGEPPIAGQKQGLVTNVNASGGDVPVADLETFLGISAGLVEGVAPGTATAGSAIRQEFTVTAGAELTFQFNHLTNESTPDGTYNDFSFFTVSGPGVQQAMLLADTNADSFASSTSIYGKSTGYQAFSYTFNAAGAYTIGFGVSDSQDTGYDTALLIDEVSVQGTSNSPPQAADDTAAVDEDDSVTIGVLANDSDPDGAPLTVAAVTQGASGVVVINGNNTVTYTPNADFHGTDSFTYTISDGNGGTDIATVDVTVTPVNDVPVATDDGAATDEDSAVTIDVLVDDSDIDGDTLTVSGVTQGGSGSVVVHGDNTVTYTPDANFHGSDSFTYTVSDGNGGTDTATVNVTVAPVNDAPLAGDDGATTDAASAVTVDVLANDSDVDGDALVVSDATQGGSGSVVVNVDNTVTYTPDAGFNGTDTFTYTVSDGRGGEVNAVVTISVNQSNRAPVASDDSATTDEDSDVTVDVLVNDTDIDGDALVISSVTQGAYGAVVANAGATVTYTPNADFFGTDTFTYTVSDGNGGQAAAIVTVTVDPVNDGPVAADDSAETAAGAAVDIDVLANDSDVDGDALSVSAVTQPSAGTATVNADGSVTYTPAAGFTGDDTFSYTVDDGSGGQATATVTVSVSDAAAVANGGFEQGLTGWEALGAVTAETADFGEAPVEGVLQALLTTKDGDGGKVSDTDLAKFLGLGGGVLDDVTKGDAKAGSAIRQTISVVAGQQLVLQYNFLTTQKTPDSKKNDFSFLSVSGPGVETAVLLADTQTDGFGKSPTSYKESTGYQTFVYTFSNSGDYVLGFGVFDTEDTRADSALLLDDVSLQTPAGAPAESEPGGEIGGGTLPNAGSSLSDAGGTAGQRDRAGDVGNAVRSSAHSASQNASFSGMGAARRSDDADTSLATAIETLLGDDVTPSQSWGELVDLVFSD